MNGRGNPRFNNPILQPEPQGIINEKLACLFAFLRPGEPLVLLINFSPPGAHPDYGIKGFLLHKKPPSYRRQTPPQDLSKKQVRCPRNSSFCPIFVIPAKAGIQL